MKRTIAIALAATVLVALASAAFAQSVPLQAGPWTPGHAPMYVGNGSAVPVIQDSGSAGGGVAGATLSELGVTVRGTGTPPYANGGTGPNGENVCDYDAPTTNATGYHYLCSSPNAQGGGLISYGAGGGASELPFEVMINGVPYPFPGTGSGDVTGPLSSTANHIATFGNTTGKLISDSGKAIPQGDVVGTTDTQTLTNKTLASPSVTGSFTVNGAAQTFPASGSIAGTSDTQTLTNKTISGSSNTLSNIPESALNAIAADSVLGNATAGSAAPGVVNLTSCSTTSSALTYSTSSHAFGCNTIVGTSASYTTVAALVAANVPASVQTITTAGYYAAGDGGGTTYIRYATTPSLPCYHQSADGAFWGLPSATSVANVKVCGAVGDNSTSDQTAINNAITIAEANHGVIYFPSLPTGDCYVGSISMQDQTGFGILGDAEGSSSSAGFGGSCLTSSGPTINIFSNTASGDTSNFFIQHMKVYGGGANNSVIIKNALHFSVSDNFIDSSTFAGLDVEGSGNFVLANNYVIGVSGLAIGNGSGTLTNSGPGVVYAGQYNSTTGNAIHFVGDTLGVSVISAMYSGEGAGCSIQIDGGTSANGDVNFYNLHGESNWGTGAGTGEDICIGANSKTFGHVGFYGGNAWGQGNGTLYHGLWMAIFSAKDVDIEGYTVSKLGNTNGYNSGMINLTSGFTGTFNFRGLQKTDIAGPLYDDSRTGSPLTNWSGNATNIGRYDGYWPTADLPTCGTANKGWSSYVTDATSSTFNAAPTGGGSTPMPVVCSGSAWAIH